MPRFPCLLSPLLLLLLLFRVSHARVISSSRDSSFLPVLPVDPLLFQNAPPVLPAAPFPPPSSSSPFLPPFRPSRVFYDPLTHSYRLWPPPPLPPPPTTVPDVSPFQMNLNAPFVHYGLDAIIPSLRDTMMIGRGQALKENHSVRWITESEPLINEHIEVPSLYREEKEHMDQ